MQQQLAHLFPTREGLALAGVILAKRSPNRSFNIRGREKEIHAQLAVHPQAMRYVERGCELLAKVSDQELEQAAYPFHPNPHARTTSGNDFSDLTKGLMMFALTGLNDMENVPEGKARLLKMQGSIHHDSLLKSYGLPTWAQLTKDDGDGDDDDEDDDEEEDEGNDSDDSGTSAGGGNSHYNPDEPRIPAGQPGGGQWTTAGNGTSTDSGSISADDIRTALREDFDNYNPSALPQGTQVADNNLVQSDASPTAASHVPVTLNDGSTVTDPATGNPIMMPSTVSLQANAAYGESIRNLPSIADGFSYPTGFYFPLDEADLEEPDNYSSKEEAMIRQFWTWNPMDYQRVSSTLTDEDGNTLIDRTYVNFGNFNYGLVAAAAGYTYEQALAGAAALNQLHSITNSNINTSGMFGGNSRNEYFIRMGYNAYTSGKINSGN